MKALVVLEERGDEPVSAVAASVREVLARAPAVDAEVAVIPCNPQSGDPLVELVWMGNAALAAMRAAPRCERGIFIRPIELTGEGLSFRGNLILFFTRTKMMKLSFSKARSSGVPPWLPEAQDQLLGRLVAEFPVVEMNDEDRRLQQVLRERVVDGFNLATARWSTTIGTA